MDALRTDRTYASKKNAVNALRIACKKAAIDFDVVRYLVAVNDEGRFAPVVLVTGARFDWTVLPHLGVTVVN